MKRPNFFILGAPKCGTSSLARWLSTHPQIYVSPVKEPHWFNKDHGYDGVRALEEYEALFSGADDSHTAVGEASATYLYSEVALVEILQYSPTAKFIAMLRDPVEMAPALHGQLLLSGDENIDDFEEAWRAQTDRRLGSRIPKWCVEPRFLLYGDACSLGRQMERVYSVVPRERVLVLFLDDLRKDPREVYDRVLTFLSVRNDGRNRFEAYNLAKKLRSKRLLRYLRALGKVKQALRLRKGFGVLSALGRLNAHMQPRTQLTQAMKQELVNYFRSDVTKLARLTDRDLSHWLRVEQLPSKATSEKAPGKAANGSRPEL
jgi:hypothetical protein